MTTDDAKGLRRCKVEGCEATASSNQMCKLHDTRVRRTGSPFLKTIRDRLLKKMIRDDSLTDQLRKITGLAADRAERIEQMPKVIAEWMRSDKPPGLAFTSGPEREIADLIVGAERRGAERMHEIWDRYCIDCDGSVQAIWIEWNRRREAGEK